MLNDDLVKGHAGFGRVLLHLPADSPSYIWRTFQAC